MNKEQNVKRIRDKDHQDPVVALSRLWQISLVSRDVRLYSKAVEGARLTSTTWIIITHKCGSPQKIQWKFGFRLYWKAVEGVRVPPLPPEGEVTNIALIGIILAISHHDHHPHHHHDRKPECASRESHPEIIGNGMVECRSCYQIGLFQQITNNLGGR